MDASPELPVPPVVPVEPPPIPGVRYVPVGETDPVAGWTAVLEVGPATVEVEDMAGVALLLLPPFVAAFAGAP